MKQALLNTALALALVTFGAAASANTLPPARYYEMMKFEMMDTNKDGMVSREEFLENAAKMFDMAAEAMKAKDGKLDAKQFSKFRSQIGGNH